MAETDDTAYAWAAGFLDGEGCFTVSRTRRYSKVRSRPLITAAQTERFDALYRLQAIFDVGHVRVHRSASGKRAGVWRVDSAGSVIHVINLVSPYLQVKWLEAATLLAFAKSIRPPNSGGHPLSPEEEQQRDAAEAFLPIARGGSSWPQT